MGDRVWVEGHWVWGALRRDGKASRIASIRVHRIIRGAHHGHRLLVKEVARASKVSPLSILPFTGSLNPGKAGKEHVEYEHAARTRLKADGVPDLRESRDKPGRSKARFGGRRDIEKTKQRAMIGWRVNDQGYWNTIDRCYDRAGRGDRFWRLWSGFRVISRGRTG